MPTLILVRHGQSQWNLENRFTGWWDVDLTEKGEQEARDSGALLAAKFSPAATMDYLINDAMISAVSGTAGIFLFKCKRDNIPQKSRRLP